MPGAAAAASKRRWDQAEPEDAAAEQPAAAAGADSDSDFDCSADEAAGELEPGPAQRFRDDAEQAAKRPRPAPGSMRPVKRGEEPWDQLGGTAQPGDALQRAVRAVLLQIETVGNPLGSDHPNIEKRIDQLVAATFQHPQITASLLREKQPNRAHQAIADGVAHKLNEMRETNTHRGTLGRLCYDAVTNAAVCRLRHTPPDQISYEDVSVKQVADALDVHRSTVYAALDRHERIALIDGVCLLDPARAQRSDATPLETINAIQGHWAASTRASPDKRPIAVMMCEDGGKVSHGIHWQEDTDAEIYMKYCNDAANPKIGKEIFRQHKPYFIKKPRWRGCLCPRCHVLRLLVEGLGDLLRECVHEDNKCSCSFCQKHKQLPSTAAADAELSYPPQSATSLHKAMHCPKLEAPADSGFTGTMPCYELGCMRNHLEGKQEKFIMNTKDDPALLETPPEKCSVCADQFPLTPPEECTFMKEAKLVTYKHYVKTPRLGTSEKKEREDLQVVSVTRPEFMQTFRAQNSEVSLHKYGADWQDESSEIMVGMRKDADHPFHHGTCGVDFAMNHTCVPKEELKQEFWNRTQVSLHPMLTYQDWPPDWEEFTHEPGAKRQMKEKKARAKRMMETHIFMSDDPKHDTVFVNDNMHELLPVWHARRAANKQPPVDWLTMLSDNGPAHYKCCRSFYNLTCWASELKPTACGLCVAGEVQGPLAQDADEPLGQATCEHLENFFIDWMFLAPDHGKSVWDGISGLKKNELAAAELKRKKGSLPLVNCKRCVEHLESKNRKKEAGFERHPFPVRAASSYSIEFCKHYITDYNKLALARTRMLDATTVSGSGSHYHMRAVRRGQLQMRWLGCPCKFCWQRDDDNCVNKNRCGTWADRVVTASAEPGVAALSAFRKTASEQIAEGIEVGDYVATWTSEDVTSRRQYWLGKVTHKPFNVGGIEAQKDGLTCPGSGHFFKPHRGDSEGEHVFRVQWLDRVGLAAEHDCVFHALHDDEYIVHVSTLRAGKVNMGAAQLAPTRTGRARMTLSPEEHKRITDVITDKFKDE